MAKKINVKCKYCEQMFDRNNEPFIKIKNRYAHPECHEKHLAAMTQEDRDIEAFYDYVGNLFKNYNYNYQLTRKLAEKYHNEYGYTYSGMHKTLVWFYEIQKNPVSNSKGSIGIIPYAYEKALDYYYSIFLAQNVNEDKEEFKTKEVVIEIEAPYVAIKPRKLFFEEDDE